MFDQKNIQLPFATDLETFPGSLQYHSFLVELDGLLKLIFIVMIDHTNKSGKNHKADKQQFKTE